MQKNQNKNKSVAGLLGEVLFSKPPFLQEMSNNEPRQQRLHLRGEQSQQSLGKKLSPVRYSHGKTSVPAKAQLLTERELELRRNVEEISGHGGAHTSLCRPQLTLRERDTAGL